MIITPASYREIPHHRDLANRIMTTLGLNPDDVTEIRTDETGTEVDVLRVPNHTIRTMTSRPQAHPLTMDPGVLSVDVRDEQRPRRSLGRWR